MAAPIALPPLSEQNRIVTEVDRRVSRLRETEAQVDANLQRAERLRQSILSQAFAGESGYAPLTRPTQNYPASETDWPMAAEPAGQYAGEPIKPGQRGA